MAAVSFHLPSIVVNIVERVLSTFLESAGGALTGGAVLIGSGASFGSSAIGVGVFAALYAVGKSVIATFIPPTGDPALFGIPAAGGHTLGSTAPPK